MAKRRVGVITRPIPSWYAREMYGGRIAQPASVGNITYGELYNSSSKGGWIFVWNIMILTANADEAVPEWYYGKKQTTTGSATSLMAGGPAGYGILGGWNNSTCVGVEIGDFGNPANVNSQWPHDFPMAMIPAGYSFAIHTKSTNEAINFGVWWQESPEY